MKYLEKYEPVKIEIISLTDIITTSEGFDGDIDNLDVLGAGNEL